MNNIVTITLFIKAYNVTEWFQTPRFENVAESVFV